MHKRRSKESISSFIITYAVFILMGLGSCLSYNIFITSKGYFEERFQGTVYEETFVNWFNAAFNTTTLVVMYIRIMCIRDRMPGPIRTVFMTIFIVISILFAHCVFTKWPTFEGYFFFHLTLASIIVVATAGTLLQDALLRILSSFPPPFTQAMVAGQAVGGLAASISNYFILASNEPTQMYDFSPKNNEDVKDGSIFQLLGSNASLSAFVYFALAFVTVFFCGTCFIGILQMDYFYCYYKVDNSDVNMKEERQKHHEKRVNKEYSFASDLEETFSEESSALEHLLAEEYDDSKQSNDLQVDNPDSVAVAFAIRFNAISVLLVFTITMALFPGITSAIESVTPKKSHFYADLFVPFSFIVFNGGDFLGRIAASWWPVLSARKLLFASLARILFIPLLLTCNVQNEHHQVITNVIFHNDWFPIIFTLLCAFSNGLLCTLTLMHYPRHLSTSQEKAAGGTIMYFMLSFGLCIGALGSFLLQDMLRV